LVPYVNGHIYAEKPPVFFWLMQLGWWLFGVNDWWPRLIAPLAALAALLLTRRLARRLWPDGQAHNFAPLILASSLYWALFTAATMFDMILSALVLVAVSALVAAWQDGRFAPFWLAGAALGVGALTKGPVILLPVAGAALGAPWWMGTAGVRWRRWYGGFMLAVLVAFAIGFAWLVPAALAGGEAYLQAIGLHQTADSIVHSFTHARPFWWYLPLLPLMLFPWSLWPANWRGLRAAGRGALADPGIRLCIAWALPAFVALSLISAKQPHYLLPLFPAVALALGRVIDRQTPARAGSWLMIGLSLLTAAVWFVGRLPHVAWPLPPAYGAGFLALAAATWLASRRANFADHLAATAFAAVAWMLLLGAGLYNATWPELDVRPLAAEVGRLAAAGAPIGHAGSYNAEYNFYPRLKRAIVELRGPAILPWVEAHAEGELIAGYPAKNAARAWPAAPLYRQPFRGDEVMIWRNADVIAHPELLDGAHK
ncbi:MAG TPA: glycosyltransferase family 39 protein, partial [Candidatus Sulfotelmatobacter sp.]|nr:glycosyltransferase family 39 protein [Candidatus Sulfotelmatobacter sp.]